MTEHHTFQAEIRQLLNILVHSLYTEREIFLRELISNASDALSKMQFELLTNKNVVSAEAPLEITITADPDAKTLRIVDTGIGMTHEEMIDNLGTIARSGAKSFVEKMKEANGTAADLIGQFGVGFYSVFMVADKVEVTSRSYLPDQAAHTWISSGEDSYEILPAAKETRGTEILIHLREDAAEFAEPWKLQQIIHRHSDYISFPIYIRKAGEEADSEQEVPEPANKQMAIWRKMANEVNDEEYDNFYRSLTFDMEKPALRIHTRADAPIQYYALLFVPRQQSQGFFNPRKEPGLKLYARKVLIQEYATNLLPEYLNFVQGVVDSEDIPLNVSREAVQTNPQMEKLKQVVTHKVLGELKKLAENDPETYAVFWENYSAYLKHGVISDYVNRDRILPLLRFYTSQSENELTTLDSYVENMVEGQDAIYYITADNVSAASRSPHLTPFRSRGISVLYLTESMDGFLVSSLNEYKGHKLSAIDTADLDLSGVGQTPEDETPAESLNEDELSQLTERIQKVLGDAIASVRVSKVLLAGSPVRLVTPEGALDRHTQRVYQMLDKQFEVPARLMEINPRHQVIRDLVKRLEQNADDPLIDQSINLLYGNALLVDGIHPNPAELSSMIESILVAAVHMNGS